MMLDFERKEVVFWKDNHLQLSKMLLERLALSFACTSLQMVSGGKTS